MQLKNLAKILDKRSRLEVLHHIAVKDGMATATDLEISASMPCDLEDGLYYGQAWSKGQFIKNQALNPDDFPQVPVKDGDRIATITSKDIAGVIEACGDKWALDGFLVEYDGRGKYLLVATDGHRLHCSGDMRFMKKKAKTNQIIVHRKVWEMLQMSDSWSLSVDKYDAFFRQGKVLVSSRLIDEKYPNYKRIFPNLSESSVIGNEALIDCMTSLYRECRRIGCRSRNNSIMLYRRGNNTLGVYQEDPVKEKTFRMESGIACQQDVMLAFNGEYIAAIDRIEGKKSVHWMGNDAVLYVEHSRGACLTMPLAL